MWQNFEKYKRKQNSCRGIKMKKRDNNEKYGFFYDEEGTNEVSQQIMDSYNSGVIDPSEQSHYQSSEQTEA
jgi:hypothetical protein